MTQRMWHNKEIKDRYDVVIIGGGAHGLATAYYLAVNHGITNVAVLEQKFIGYGGSGRNTAILRSNYRTEEGIKFYDQALKLYEDLAQDLD
ncbi:MAG: FAD-dependent oxidoreductase, partial [SAR324 cluster bacterium]|nr:FAD-dependent oxidoreductase [SAR324 cluster bacterium]